MYEPTTAINPTLFIYSAVLILYSYLNLQLIPAWSCKSKIFHRERSKSYKPPVTKLQAKVPSYIHDNEEALQNIQSNSIPSQFVGRYDR